MPLNAAHAFLRTTSCRLFRLDFKHLFLVSVAAAVTLSELVAATTSLVMIGEVPPVVWVAAFVTPLVVASAITVILVAIIDHLRQEVRDRIRAEQALLSAKEQAELANRAKSEFLANMSHELRSPLNAIIGFAEILKSELFGPLGLPQYREYAQDVLDSGTHLLEIINDILDLSKVEAGKLELHEGTVDVRSAIVACTKLIRARAEEAEVRLHTEVSRDLPDLYADEIKVKQILLNLLSNAVKFTPEGGRVTTTAQVDDGGRFVLSVADTGIGIAPENIGKAMSAFGQVDSSLARRYQGTGLGLPLSKALAELHGGTLALESEQGVGTTVTVTLPPLPRPCP
jgi:signal transduction histidine kinase